MDRTGPEDQLAGIAVLAEPVRRALYLYVSSRVEPVGRDEAARDLGIARSLAAFHLDRLVEEGLLEAGYRRLSGRVGPGAGRPAKVYRRSAREIQVSVPPRNYELAARMLIRAVEGPRGARDPAATSYAARAFGEALGRETRRRAGTRRGRARTVEALVEVLGEHGFEPLSGPVGEIRLRNCPFHALARDHRDLVCGMNLEAMRGVLDGLRATGLEAAVDPGPDTCCVLFRRRGPTRAATL
ncbi:MAG: helix-turn-helix transcriptional regulator [Actinomycetota bacterium]